MPGSFPARLDRGRWDFEYLSSNYKMFLRVTTCQWQARTANRFRNRARHRRSSVRLLNNSLLCRPPFAGLRRLEVAMKSIEH